MRLSITAIEQKMTTTIRSLADLHLLKSVLSDVGASVESNTPKKLSPAGEKATTHIPDPRALPKEDSAALADLEGILKQHDFWLGYSSVKGWALLDRKHPQYNDWNRPFVLLRDGSIDRLSREEFSKEPNGPWALGYWRRLDSVTKQLAGPASALLPELLRYVREVERTAKPRAKHIVDNNEDLATRIGDPPFSEALYYTSGLEFQEKWAAARREHYATALPGRVRWLSRWAQQIQGGATGLEPTWARGTAAARHLHENGIDHLWHFTDVRNLDLIRREGGLLSWAGLSVLGINNAHLMADDFSRSCDARLGRERYVRLSFIPNSWFFHRVRRQSPLVWLRFSAQALALGEIAYSLGNAASGFVALQQDLPSMGINWEMVMPFSGPHTNDKGPTIYRRLFPEQVGDPILFRQISNAWNSEVLIKHFLPLEFCNGAFDSRTGERIQIQ